MSPYKFDPPRQLKPRPGRPFMIHGRDVLAAVIGALPCRACGADPATPCECVTRNPTRWN